MSDAPVCRHCHDPARPVCRPRGLCWDCWWSPARDLYKSLSKFARKSVRPVAYKPPGDCRHCGRNKASRPRGLCHGCYLDKTVRAKHEPRRHVPPGETMAEVEAVIAEQMLCLPIWWDTDAAYMAELERRGAKIERATR